jgi:DNA-binding response OmpR family regulator
MRRVYVMRIESESAQSRQRPRILIADDEANVREFMKASLNGDTDYEIFEAEDGRAALAIIESRPIDLMITDVCMPERDGLEAIRALRRNGRPLKILAVSGAFDGFFLRTAKMFGADATLGKPFGPGELSACVSALLQE